MVPLDGTFLHFLTNELNAELTNFKINKIYQPSFNEIIIQTRGKNKNGLIVPKDLFLSCNLDKPKIYLTTKKYTNPDVPLNFTMLLRKYIDRGVIKTFKQYNNDRILEIYIDSANELGDSKTFILIFEIMGRNSNIILTNDSYQIIDAIRKFVPSDSNTRTIIPKATYVFPAQANTINPFDVEELTSLNYHMLEGCSKILQNELKELEITNIKDFLNKRIFPTLFKNNNKIDFYFTDLTTVSYSEKVHFKTLSELLENSLVTTDIITNYQINNLVKHIKRILVNKRQKIGNLEEDLQKATENLKYNHLGILLQSNLYLAKYGLSELVVYDFLDEQKEITIKLDPLLSPSDNLNKIFKKGKKATTAISKVNEQLLITQDEIAYLEEIVEQLSFASNTDFEEIKSELSSNGYLKKKVDKKTKKTKKVNLNKICLENSTILIGKNNIQNEYLIHKVAMKNDLWFHVKDAPGAHVVLVVPNNSDSYLPTEEEIRLASNIAAYFSKYSKSSSVAVDYTKIKNLKKIPKHQGYNVTYTNNKTIYIDPDDELIKKYKLKNL